jgi:hypothetical protein
MKRLVLTLCAIVDAGDLFHQRVPYNVTHVAGDVIDELSVRVFTSTSDCEGKGTLVNGRDEGSPCKHTDCHGSEEELMLAHGLEDRQSPKAKCHPDASPDVGGRRPVGLCRIR